MNQGISFGSFVRQRRREIDLTQEELARRVGCAAITLRKIEADDLRPSVQIAERLAMALAIPLDDRADFVRRARAVHPEAADFPAITPSPSLDEIGREDLTGRAIRGYALAERIGMGGMGSVYRAVQPNVEREVAVKIILPAFANHPDFIRRFEAEAQLVARLEHPHIVPLYDYWREPGVAYLVMRLLRGGNVQNLLGQGPLPMEITTHLLEQICSALNAAHRIGVIHRDLKPANVLLDEDQNAYLADFGIAKNISDPDLEHKTQIDEMIGTPHYMSPEQIRSLSIKPQTDIYCLGIMLYEMLTGALPFAGPTPIDFIQQHINAPMPSLAAHHTGLPALLDMVIGRATAKNPEDRYEDASTLFKDFRQAVSGMMDAHPIPIYFEEETDTEIVNPFKGLRAFSEADAENFFGRETLVQQLLARLGEGGDLSRFLAVIGPSGSGKSSVVRAGLIPALRRGGLPGSENWFIVDMLPGKHPFEELEASLLRVAVNPPEHLLSQMKDGDRGLLRAVHRILPVDESVELVLVIDQFEEVFTLIEDEAERALLLENLASAVLDERSRLRVVITLRADFTDKPLRYVDFGELINRRFEFILPLTADELERAILNPTQRVGLKLEKGLVSTIIREVGNQPGALPLLQYALSELFDKRDGRTLTNKAYQEIGGVLGALGRSAETIYSNLDEAAQYAARQLFLRLVTLGEGTEDTRRRVLRDELESLLTTDRQLSAVIDTFGEARLLSFDRDPLTRGATIEVAHEALLREWMRLREWLNESRADVRIQRQLNHAVQEWQNAKRDSSFLLSGTRLAQFEDWAANTSITLTQAEQTFIEASVIERQRRDSEEQARRQRELESARKLTNEQKRANRWLLSALLGVGTFLLFTLCATSLAVRQSFVALSRQLASQAQNQLNTNPEVAILLALEAEHYSKTDVAMDVLASAPFAYPPIEATLWGHTDSAYNVYSVDWSPDGKQIASGSRGAIIIWDVASRQPRTTLTGNNLSLVESVAWSPDGKQIAAGSNNSIIIIWDVASGQPQATLMTGNKGAAVNSVAWRPNGKQLASGAEDNTVIIWDVASGQALATLQGHTESLQADRKPSVESVDWSPDGRQLASGARDGTIIIWDAASGQLQTTLQGHTDMIDSVVWSPNGKQLASGSFDNTIIIWDVASGQSQSTLQGHMLEGGLGWSPDGKQLASGSQDNTVIIWDLANHQPQITLRGHTGGVVSVAWSPDGKHLASSEYSKNGNIIIWDTTSGPSSIVLEKPIGDVYSVAWSPDGKQLASRSGNETIVIWDAVSSEPTSTLGPTNALRCLAWSPDGKQLASQTGNTIIVWDIASSQPTATLEGHADSTIGCVDWSPDGKQLASGSQDNTVIIWDVASGQLLATLKGHTETVGIARDIASQGVTNVDWSPDGKQLASGAGDGTVIIWDVASYKPQATLRVYNEPVFGVAWSPDGKQLASSAWDTVIIWDVASSQRLAVLTDRSSLVNDVMWSPDGKQISTTKRPFNTGPEITIWNVVDRQLLTRLKVPNGTNNMAWSPDGQRLAFGSENSIYILQTQYIRAPCELVSRNLTEEEWQEYMPWYLPYHKTCEQWADGE